MASRMVTTYIETARALPIPSDEQTRAFAEYVTGAHSWYKHLPILPLSPFVFFLDPNAGRSMVHVSDDAVAFVDNKDDDRGIHYTWQTTESYRRRFGLWNYEAPYGTSLQYMGDQGVIDTAGPGLNVADADSTCWLKLPTPMIETGTAMVSSLMYMIFAPEGQTPFCYDESRVSMLMLSRGLPPEAPGQCEAIGVIHQLLRLRDDEAFVRDQSVFETSRRALSAEAEASGRSWSSVYETDACKAAQSAWEQTTSRQQEIAAMRTLIAAVDVERANQIAGMQAAMRRFVETLHADAPGSA